MNQQYIFKTILKDYVKILGFPKNKGYDNISTYILIFSLNMIFLLQEPTNAHVNKLKNQSTLKIDNASKYHIPKYLYCQKVIKRY